MCPKIQITAKGIRRALSRYTPYQSLAEYIWNGFDAQASEIKISYVANEIGNIESINISDNGYGIIHGRLQEKFEPVFESKKAGENKQKNQSAVHGKNGTGRLTFFCFARNAVWKTVYPENENCWTYEIYSNAENINLYTGINALPRKTEELPGTTVTFSGIHGITAPQLEEKFREFLLKEFSWFLALNEKRNFYISINGVAIDHRENVADIDEFAVNHEKSGTEFNIRYIRWKEKHPNESSSYYYLNSLNKECWKENSPIQNKGEKFYHSIFIQSPYFDSFAFQSDELAQEPLLEGTRRDSQFRHLRRKLANYLRIKRRPFLKDFAEKLIQEYELANIFSKDIQGEEKSKLSAAAKTLYEMQPRLFSSLNTDQKKMLMGMFGLIIKSNQIEKLPDFFNELIELNKEERQELEKIFKA
jgi:hypothetical protein